MMFMKIFMKTRVCLILVFILNMRDFMILLIKKWLEKKRGEIKEKIINEFVGLKLNMYSLVTVNDIEIKKKIVDSIRHKKYVDVLFGRGLIRHNMKRIQSRLHRIRTYDVCKLSLSCFNNKSYILDNRVIFYNFHRDVLILVFWFIFIERY